MNKTGFLQSSPGNFSSMRAAFALIILVSLGLTVLMVLKEKPIVDVVTLYTTMTATAITLKTIQNSQENKEKDVPPTA
jgi:hypothetical protein